MVAHPVDVGAARCVRLGRHAAAVGMKSHPDHVGGHDPVSPVDEGGPHPPSHGLRVGARCQRQVPEHHQPFDVVNVRLVVQRLDGVRNTRHLGRGVAGERVEAHASSAFESA